MWTAICHGAGGIWAEPQSMNRVWQVKRNRGKIFQVKKAEVRRWR